MTRALRLAVVGAAAFFVCATGVGAQSASSSSSAKPDSGWGYTVTPYGWVPRVTGMLGVGPVDAHIDLSPHELLKFLKFAAMVNGEARHNGIILGLDAIYVKLADADAVAVRGETGDLRAQLRLWIVQPTIGHAIAINKTLSVDALLGFRFWYVGVDLDASGPRGATIRRSRSGDWFDATGGLRLNWTPKERFRLVLGGDGGGGGAWNDWQGYGTAGYDVSTRWTVGAGYRIMSVNRRSDRALFDARFKGFGVYGTYRFGKH